VEDGCSSDFASFWLRPKAALCNPCPKTYFSFLLCGSMVKHKKRGTFCPPPVARILCCIIGLSFFFHLTIKVIVPGPSRCVVSVMKESIWGGRLIDPNATNYLSITSISATDVQGYPLTSENATNPTYRAYFG
jgi:hypothetical protein